YGKAGQLDAMVAADAVLVDSLLAQGRAPEARQAFEPASAALGSLQAKRSRLAVELAGARLRAASGAPEDRAAAESALSAAVEEAEQAGLAGPRLEAGLLLGRVELAAGQAEAGRARLEAVEKEAS